MMDQHGFTTPQSFMEPLDHIAMEWLFFMTVVRNGKYAEAHRFKSEHMDTWMDRACASIIEKDDMGFYTGIANLTKAALLEIS